MRYGKLPVALAFGAIFLTGCAADYSFRVTADSFPTETGGLGTGNPTGQLPGSGWFDGVPAGDGYLAGGEVVVTGDEIAVSSVYHPGQPAEIGLFHMVGRPIANGESPTSVIIRFDSAYDGITGASSPFTMFTVQDVDGDTGFAFNISGVGVNTFIGEDVSAINFGDSELNFYSNGWHSVVVQINFATHKGRITVIQGELEGSRDFVTPANFGIFKALKMEVVSLSHIIARPEAIFLHVEQGQYVYGCSHDARAQSCLAYRCADAESGLACDQASSRQGKAAACSSYCSSARAAEFRPVSMLDFELGCPRGVSNCNEKPEPMTFCSHRPEEQSCAFTTCLEVDGRCTHTSKSVRSKAACINYCAAQYTR